MKSILEEIDSVERYSTDRNYKGPRDVSELREESIQAILEEEKVVPRWITCDEWEEEEEEDEKPYWYVPYGKKFYNGRNYALFAILADVRNDGSIEHITDPKGIPKDASYAYQVEAKQMEGDAHSHSYFTLEELQNVDWTKYPTDYINGFLNTMNKMSKLDTDPSKIRCCFYFDN